MHFRHCGQPVQLREVHTLCTPTPYAQLGATVDLMLCDCAAPRCQIQQVMALQYYDVAGRPCGPPERVKPRDEAQWRHWLRSHRHRGPEFIDPTRHSRIAVDLVQRSRPAIPHDLQLVPVA